MKNGIGVTIVVYYVQISEDGEKWKFSAKSPYYLSKIEALSSRHWKNACDYSDFKRIKEQAITLYEGMKGYKEASLRERDAEKSFNRQHPELNP